MTNEILFEEINRWGVITLNRPKALNALTHAMVKAMRSKLAEWEVAEHIAAVMVKGEGDRAFCAGGDIRWLYETAKEDVTAACEFFRDEYTNNAAIFHFSKPYVALIDGIVMGGGVGVSVHGDFRVAGENTMFAMPETGIGLFPDVGGGYFMPRLADNLGMYYALTGVRANGADCLATGIATHYVASEQHDKMIEALLSLSDQEVIDHSTIEGCLSVYETKPLENNVSRIRVPVNRLFTRSDSLEMLLERLRHDNSEFAKMTLATLSRMSPTSLKLTRVVSRVMAGHDFFEGVRALIIDKDKLPKWSPDSLDGVRDKDITEYFMPLNEHELKL